MRKSSDDEGKVLVYTRPPVSEAQAELLDSPKRFLWVPAATKTGKLLSVDTPVITPAGPVPIGTLAVGDTVCSPDGVESVVGVYPQGQKQLYAVTFCDGSTLEAGAEHLWEVEIPRKGAIVVSTADLIAMRDRHFGCFRRARLPRIQPVQFQVSPVPADPYLIGALIGNGGLTTSAIRFSSVDEETLARVRAALPPGHALEQRGNHCDYSILTGCDSPLRAALRDLGLSGKYSHEKRIPQSYLINSIEVREAVLSGIMDTDGFIGKAGEPCIDQTSKGLAEDIKFLVESLGGSVLTREKRESFYRDANDEKAMCRQVYRQVLRLPDTSRVFRLSRKRDRCLQKKKSGLRTLRSITPTRAAEAVCIEVTGDRKLYLADHFIPTHNTVADAIWINEGLLQGMRCAWVGPWHKRTKTGYEHVKSFLSEWIEAGYAKARDTDLTIEVKQTTTGRTGTLTCFSGDNPDGVYGDAFDRVVCDEATRQPEAVFHAIRSTVTATGGSVRFTFNTDRGSRNWAIREAMRAKRGEEPSYGFLTMRADESPYIDPADIEQARRTLPDRVFEALYNAVVHEDGAGVFTHPESCVGGLLMPPLFGKTYVIGVDLARKRDYTVAIVMDRLTRHVVHMERMHGLSWRLQREKLAELSKRYNRAKVIVDATGVGDPNLEELQRAGVWCEGVVIGTNSAKRDLIEGLIVAIEQRRITYPALPVLLGELEVFEYDTTKSGTMVYSAPDGYHDDCVLALALAVKGLGSMPNLPAEAYSQIVYGVCESSAEGFECL